MDNRIIVLYAIVIAIAVVGVVYFYCLNKTEQLRKIKEWLCYAVVAAELDLGEGTGQLKLRYVYDWFVDKFGILAYFISFELFESLVDDALETMKDLLSDEQIISELIVENI